MGRAMKIFEDPGTDDFRGLNLKSLRIDEAYVVVKSFLKEKVTLYGQNTDCSQCALVRLVDIPANKNASTVVSTKYAWNFRIRSSNLEDYISHSNDPANVCDLGVNTLGEFGVYDITASSTNGKVGCQFVVAKEPVNIYYPLLACFLFYVALALLWMMASWAVNKKVCFGWLRKKSSTPSDTNGNIELGKVEANVGLNPAPPARQRLKSLDVVRGISIVLMIFVNDGGGQYSFFNHATWNGLTVADLLFPWFMWIMGVCMPMSIRSSLKRKEPRWKIFVNTLRRSCTLFLLGLMLNSLGGPIHFETFRIPGVLQRFSISYLVVGTVALCLTPVDLTCLSMEKWRIVLQDVIVLLPHWFVAILLLVAHCLITFLLPVPGCPTGYLGPGGLHLDGLYKNSTCVGGATGLIDRWFFTLNHSYNYPTSDAVYHSGPFDPEGMLGSLLCIFQVFLGYQAGTTLLVFTAVKDRVLRWLSWGVFCGAVAAILCKVSQDDGWIPVNKNLWSLSFVMVTSCFAFFLLCFCYLLVDVYQVWNGAPFFYPGMNGIFMYVGHEVAYTLFPWHWRTADMNTHFEMLVENLWGTSLWVIVSTWLFYKKVFITV